jgi:hypothetical protein
VFAQHRVEHTSLGREKFVILHFPGIPLPVGDLKDGAEQVRERLVGTKDAEITRALIQLGHIAQEGPQHLRIALLDRAGSRHLHRMVVKVGHSEIM